MRGKELRVETGFPDNRITPACAGKSRSVQGPAGSCGDHPRVCGEKSLKGVTLTAPAGSPPRVRGKVVDRFSYAVAFGITPAYAGKSCWCFCWSAGCWDHPRVCGEKCGTASNTSWVRGSPPRMRGKASWPTSTKIPARDHPRVCGEKMPLLVLPLLVVGSPPRMRGKGRGQRQLLRGLGITPAYAGKRRRGISGKSR